MRGITFSFIAALVLAIPSAAIAGHNGSRNTCTNAAACQYVEHVPGGGGDGTTGGGHGGGGHSGGGGGGGGHSGGGGSGGGGQPGVSASTQQALQSHGNAGAGTAALADQTAQRGAGNGRGGSGADGSHKGGSRQGASDGTAGTDGIASDQTGGSPKIGTALGHVIGSSDAASGMGLALPIILGLSLLGALLIVLLTALRRRRLAEPH